MPTDITPLRENPYMRAGQWYWFDENEVEHGPYAQQRTALYALLTRCDLLAGSLPWWKRVLRWAAA